MSKNESIDNLKLDILKECDIEDVINQIEKVNDGVNYDDDSSDIVEEPPRNDFDSILEKCKSKSSKIIKNLVEFYVEPKLMDNDYVKRKMMVDNINLTNCIYQMRTSQISITKILKLIDSGTSTNPQMFRALTELQKSNLEILKYFKQYISLMENDYETFNRYTSKTLDTDSDVVDVKSLNNPSDDKFVTKGTKNLANHIKEIKSDIDIDDVIKINKKL